MKYIFVLIFFVLSVIASEREDKKIDSYDILNIEDNDSRESMQKRLDKHLGLTPHKVNYLLPYGHSSANYKSYVPTDEYRNVEAELQVSLKLYIGTNLLGFDESYYLAYSHVAFWQIHAKSSPFRETNYTPEAFVDFPITKKDMFYKIWHSSYIKWSRE